jgi:itaconate CoA-transferase
VVCDISGYGESGPMVQKKAYDLLIQAESGLISVTGSPDEPSRVGISIADIATGMYAVTGITGRAAAARAHRRGRQRQGRHARCAGRVDDLSDAAPRLCRIAAAARAHQPSGDRAIRRASDQGRLRSSSDCRTSANGHVSAQTSCGPECQTDPRFASQHARRENRDALTALIEDILQRPMTSAEVAALLDAARHRQRPPERSD